MRFLRQNTATRITVGPMLDKTDGVTPKTSLTVTNEKLTFVVDDGGVPTLVLDTAPTASGGSNDMVHVTNDDAGFYDLELAAANVNYVGRAMLALTDAANHCPVFHEFTILPANVYDSLMGTDKLDVNAAELGGTSQTGRDVGASVLLSVGTGAGQVNLSSGKIPATVAAADVSGNPSVNVAAISGDTTAADNLESYCDGTTPIPANTTQISGDATAADNLEAAYDGAGYAGGTIKQKVDVETIKTQAVTCAAGVTVLASVGTAATSTAQTGDAYARLGAPAGASVSADVAAVKSDSGAIKTKTDYLPSATAGSAGGVFIAGSNAATSITTALTANITGNLSGSVGSVTGAVGSVTGAVGSVTGAVGSVTGNVGGSVASVTAGVTLANGAHGGAATVITLQTPIVANATQIEGVDATDAITAAATAATPTVTAATVSDKTGYSLDAAYDAAKTAAQAGNQMDLINAPNATAVTAIQAGLAGATELATVDTIVDAIKAKTDNLPAEPAGVSDIPTAAGVADAVWDEPIAGHGTPLTTGAILASAASAGDPWSTVLPGAYAPGTAGAMMADVSTQAALIPAAGPASAEHFTAARAEKLDDVGGAVASVTAPVTVDAASVQALKATLVGIVGLNWNRKG